MTTSDDARPISVSDPVPNQPVNPLLELSDEVHALGERELLRLATAGSVDDGKSTLIGRLLYDSHVTFEDQLASIELTSKQRGLSLIHI